MKDFTLSRSSSSLVCSLYFDRPKNQALKRVEIRNQNWRPMSSWGQGGAGSVGCSRVLPQPPRPSGGQHCIPSLTARPHSSCFPTHSHCQIKHLSVLFPSPLPLVSILSSSFHFSSPFLCPSSFPFLLHSLFISVSHVPLKTEHGTGSRKPLPHGKSPVLLQLVLSQTTGHWHNISHVIILKFDLH